MSWGRSSANGPSRPFFPPPPDGREAPRRSSGPRRQARARSREPFRSRGPSMPDPSLPPTRTPSAASDAPSSTGPLPAPAIGWTQARGRLLAALWLDGLSATDVARRLGGSPATRSSAKCTDSASRRGSSRPSRPLVRRSSNRGCVSIRHGVASQPRRPRYRGRPRRPSTAATWSLCSSLGAAGSECRSVIRKRRASGFAAWRLPGDPTVQRTAPSPFDIQPGRDQARAALDGRAVVTAREVVRRLDVGALAARRPRRRAASLIRCAA